MFRLSAKRQRDFPRWCCNRLSSHFSGNATLIPIHYIPSMTLSQLLLSQTEKEIAANCCCKSWTLASLAREEFIALTFTNYKRQEKKNL